MISSLKKAYGGGVRAGRAPSVMICHYDGTKALSTPECPYKGKFALLLRAAWRSGWHAGMMQKLSNARSA